MEAKPAELLAATGLARLLVAAERRREAGDLRAPVCASFSEGLEASALSAAKPLLALRSLCLHKSLEPRSKGVSPRSSTDFVSDR